MFPSPAVEELGFESVALISRPRSCWVKSRVDLLLYHMEVWLVFGCIKLSSNGSETYVLNELSSIQTKITENVNRDKIGGSEYKNTL